ncbi:uncharacterized protein LOC132046145 [Lycium ferocissimum]|uniref:uncharacterized protein LOC132046145 n=1 Tax=Lycium ferocissimum TaxID=112874 RepID=UPI0028159931|nr:uncharacterized protein LOC132046145 [Lycium ferocissimum]
MVVGESSSVAEYSHVEYDRVNDMVNDAFGIRCRFEHEQSFEKPHNEEAMRFYQELEEANRPLWIGFLQAAMDSMIKLVGELVSPKFDIPKSYYEAKRSVSKLGLSYDRIHCCPNGCMLFYKKDADLNECKLCGHARYRQTPSGKMVPIKAMHYLPIIDSIKRLFASPSYPPHMRWHSENRRTTGVMCHPSDREAWKHFDIAYPDFASEPRNICLGVVTYDISTKSNFNMRASLMWTINDFPAYGMLFGWMTAGKLACPHCMENRVTVLKDNLLQHNVMHIEKNYFDNLFNTVMDVKGKTKDNPKARLNLKEYYRRPELNLQELANYKVFKPKASFSYTLDEKREICQRVKNLQMPEGYASNFDKRADMNDGKGDCRLLKEYGNQSREISLFFKDLCSNTLTVENLQRTEQNMPVITTKLEKIFPCGLFDVMKHLPIRLVQEVQTRWMYPFERTIGKCKKLAKQRSKIEGSICEAHLAKETTHLCSYYFGEQVSCMRNKSNRNDEGGVDPNYPPMSIFNQPGRDSKNPPKRTLSSMERQSAVTHVLLNCPEIQVYQTGEHSQFVKDISLGLCNEVKTMKKYIVNGYKFQTEEVSQYKKTNNSGVCIKGDAMVYYAPYPLRRDKADWWVVIKTKPVLSVLMAKVGELGENAKRSGENNGSTKRRSDGAIRRAAKHSRGPSN